MVEFPRASPTLEFVALPADTLGMAFTPFGEALAKGMCRDNVFPLDTPRTLLAVLHLVAAALEVDLERSAVTAVAVQRLLVICIDGPKMLLCLPERFDSRVAMACLWTAFAGGKTQ